MLGFIGFCEAPIKGRELANGLNVQDKGRQKMSRRVVVIGGVALGTKAACRAKRIDPTTQVTLIDKDEYISYGGCGIPYYVSGDVADHTALQSTAYHMVRNEEFFKTIKGFEEVVTGTTVTRIDREAKVVWAKGKDGVEKSYPYDKLVIGAGSRTRDLQIPGQELAGIHAVGNLEDAMAIKERIAGGSVESAVIVGAGFIGLEMAEALADMWGIETSVVEIGDQIMPGFVGKQMAHMAQRSMEENDVTFYLGETVKSFEGEEGAVKKVTTDKRTLEADLVIMAVGILANGELARDAGLEVGATGGIVVNEKLQTTDPDIYSGGDCIELKHAISGKVGIWPLGSLANRQGRVIGTNMCGGSATTEAPVGSFVVKLFDKSLAGAGLTRKAAEEAGFDAISVSMCQLDRAHFYPEKELMFLELVVEKATKRVLGIQGFAGSGDAMVGRINAVAATLKYKPTILDISNLEFAYSPPFSSAMDIVNALANVADNVVDGLLNPIPVETFEGLWEEGDCVFIDCRELPDSTPFKEKFPEKWMTIPQGEMKKRIAEVPEGKLVVLVCNTGVRSFEAQLNLREMGITNTVSVQGGMATLKTWGSKVSE